MTMMENNVTQSPCYVPPHNISYLLSNYSHLSADTDDNDNEAAAMFRFQRIRQISYGYVLPTILALGILGNSLNVAVFSQKRLWLKQDVMERSAMIGLVCLAVADLFFCIVGFPSAFVKVRHFVGPDDYGHFALIALYYTTYRNSLLNIFVFMSTWFIITLSVERYVAVAHPFKAKNFISVRRTLLLKLAVFIVSVVINVPDFMRYNINHIPCEAHSCAGACGFFAQPNPQWYKTTLVLVYRILWHTVGTFLPCIILTFCNIRLLMEIYRSVAHAKKIAHNEQKQDPTTITVILILIVSMFLLLVCPSMLLTFLTDCILQAAAPATIQHLQTAVIVTNLTQAVNFAINFLLYCAFSPKFRAGLLNYSCREPPVSSQSNDVVSRLI